MSEVKTYVIVERDGQWCVLTADESRTLGCHPTKAEAEAQLRAVEANKNQSDLVDVRDVEVFKTGTWNGDPYVVKDLDAMVEAFGRVGFVPPVKIGHVDAPDAPAYGIVTALKRVGQRLLASFRVPQAVADAIRSLHFPQLSSEVIWDLERNGKTFARVLKAVALLGAEIPAVDLKPVFENLAISGLAYKSARVYIQTMKEDGAMPEVLITVDQMEQFCPSCAEKMRKGKITAFKIPYDDAAKTYQIENIPPQMLEGLCAKYEPQEGFRTRCMDDIDPVITDPGAFCNALKEHCTGLTERAKAKAADQHQAEDDPNATADALRARIAELKAQIAGMEGQKMGEETLVKLQSDLDAARADLKEKEARLSAIEADRRKEHIASRVAALRIPKYRPYVQVLYEIANAPSTSETKVVKFSADGKDPKDTTPEAVVEALVDAMNKDAVKLFGERSTVATDRKDAPEYTDPHAEADRRVREHMREKGEKDYQVALRAVLDADEDLKKAYAGLK